MKPTNSSPSLFIASAALSLISLKVGRGILGAKSIPRRNAHPNSFDSILHTLNVEHDEATILPTAGLASGSIIIGIISTLWL